MSAAVGTARIPRQRANSDAPTVAFPTAEVLATAAGRNGKVDDRADNTRRGMIYMHREDGTGPIPVGDNELTAEAVATAAVVNAQLADPNTPDAVKNVTRLSMHIVARDPLNVAVVNEVTAILASQGLSAAAKLGALAAVDAQHSPRVGRPTAGPGLAGDLMLTVLELLDTPGLSAEAKLWALRGLAGDFAPLPDCPEWCVKCEFPDPGVVDHYSSTWSGTDPYNEGTWKIRVTQRHTYKGVEPAVVDVTGIDDAFGSVKMIVRDLLAAELLKDRINAEGAL